ncbi:MAG: hypothetical protein PVJ53_01770 [Desulfobacterales bacterium]|jgi:hypothetical protein
MTEKYLRMNDEVFVFHPDTYEVVRIASKRIQQLHHPEEIRRLRLTAVEITRQQAERAAPELGSMHCPAT